MSLFYSFAYRIGFTPWEKVGDHPATAEQVTALFEREERGRRAPFGRALDLGCGRGKWSVVLAQRGWDVTGVDLVPNAIAAASGRARAAGVRPDLRQGDITSLKTAGIGSGFRLVWDFGTVHGLPPDQVRALGRDLTELTTEDATVLLGVWTPGRRGPLPRGLSRGEIEQAFDRWTIVDEESFVHLDALPQRLKNVRPTFYRLRRA